MATDGDWGAFIAWDPVAGKRAWTIPEKFMVMSGAVATAGDLVFYGTTDGWFRAVDARTGKVLWQQKLSSGIIGQPMTYLGPDGRQYVAIASGVGGAAGVQSGRPGFPRARLDVVCVLARRQGCRRSAAATVGRSPQATVKTATAIAACWPAPRSARGATGWIVLAAKQTRSRMSEPRRSAHVRALAPRITDRRSGRRGAGAMCRCTWPIRWRRAGRVARRQSPVHAAMNCAGCHGYGGDGGMGPEPDRSATGTYGGTPVGDLQVHSTRAAPRACRPGARRCRRNRSGS